MLVVGGTRCHNLILTRRRLTRPRPDIIPTIVIRRLGVNWLRVFARLMFVRHIPSISCQSSKFPKQFNSLFRQYISSSEPKPPYLGGFSVDWSRVAAISTDRELLAPLDYA